MALTIKVLGSGIIGTTQADNQLFTAADYTNNQVPGGRAVIVKSMRFLNTGTSAKTLTVKYKQGSANAFAAFPAGIVLPPNGMVILDEELILVPGDKLQADFGESATTNVVNFIVGGVERDQ